MRAFMAVFAIVSMALVPSGYMPARADDGTIYLMICPGSKAPAQPEPIDHAAMDHSQMDHASMGHAVQTDAHDDHDAAGFDMRCDYSGGSLAPTPNAPVIGYAPLFWTPRQAYAPAPLTGIFPAKLPPSTGPPVS